MSLDRVREYLAYDRETGVFTWLKARNNRVPAGTRAGAVVKNGYRRIAFATAAGKKKTYPAHKLAWFFVYGIWPPGQVDHRNRIRDDDRIENLRLATANQNNSNRRSAKGSSSQYLGVCRYRNRVWQAQIKVGGRVRHIGYFQEETNAARAYDAAALKSHGDFANLNFPQDKAA